MPLQEKKWWKKMFKKDKPIKKVDMLTDLQAIKEFIAEAKTDLQVLQPFLEELEELEKERQVLSKENFLQANLQTQDEIIDKLLERYEFFQNDVDINAIRLKRVVAEYLKNLGQAELKELQHEKKRKWKMEL